jgi:hypothetical protein
LSCYNQFMEALRFKPVAYFRGDDTSPFQDYSGYNAAGVLNSGTESHGLPLTSDATYSQRFDQTSQGLFQAPVYVKGKEASPFTLAAVIYPVITGATGNQQVISHGGRFDGISINGTVISFGTFYTNTGQATASYDIKLAKRTEVVGVHTQTKNSLYIDGILVSEVDITSGQQADSYDIVDSNFICGYTAVTTQKVLVNGLGFYGRALQSEEVASLYRANSRRVLGSVPKQFGGEDILLGTAIRIPYLDTGWSTEEEWKSAQLSGVVVDNGQLTATMNNGLTMSGTWIDSIDLYNGATPSPVNSVNMWWDGKNETVEASIDGTTWSAVTKGTNLSIIPEGFDPINKALYIRVTFPAGVDAAYIDNMQVKGYMGNTAVSNNRIVTYTNPVAAFSEQAPADLRDDWGVRMNTTAATVVISPDTTSEVPLPVRTVEVWVKPTGTYGTGIAGTFTGYVNGVVNGPIPQGEWSILHYAFTANVTGIITLSGAAQIGKVAIYDTALSQADVNAIIANYTGVQKARYDASASVTITEPATPAVIYAHDWSIQST